MVSKDKAEDSTGSGGSRERTPNLVLVNQDPTHIGRILPIAPGNALGAVGDTETSQDASQRRE